MVWQKAMALVTQVHGMTGSYPASELYGLTSQTRRSAVSIPSNIAEGYGRNSTSDYLRFLRMTNGSLYELQTQVEIAVNLNYIGRDCFEDVYELSREIERMLASLIRSVQNNQK